MIFNKINSLFDEYAWQIDSSSRSSVYTITSFSTSYGLLSSFFDVDYYQITPGIGTFQLVVTTEGLNNNLLLSNAFDIKITDSSGNIILNADNLGPDIYSDSITFTSSNNNSYFVEVRNSTFTSYTYAATINSAQSGGASSPFSGLNSLYREGESITFSYTMSGTPGTSGTVNFFLAGITQADTTTVLSGPTSGHFISKSIFFSAVSGIGSVSATIDLKDDGVTEGTEVVGPAKHRNPLSSLRFQGQC